ncbi:MAG: DNA-3-methyladenine glycosylase I [Pseudomonadota bacterium]
MTEGLITGADGVTRCWWCGDAPDYVAYHDQEWGRRITDDARLFEKVCLEGFQSGLSWLTILRKRDNFRAAFAGFEIDRVAAFGEADVARLLGDAGIVRHRGKIEAAINNARAAQALRDEAGSLFAYFDRWRPDAADRPERIWKHSIPGETATSRALSKDLKRRGWRFVGPTTMYAFMQAMGLVNDHLEGCAFRDRMEG